MAGPSKWHRVLALSLAGVVLALLALGAYVVTVDHGYLKAEIERQLTASLGRQVAIDGEVHLTVRRKVRVSIRGLRIASEPWTEKPDLLHVGKLVATIDTLSLLNGPVIVDSLAIDDTLFCLEKHPDGRVNWQLKNPDAPPEPAAEDGLPLLVRTIRLENFRAVLKSPDLGQKLYVTVNKLEQAVDEHGVIAGRLAGSVNETALAFTTRVDNLQSLLDDEAVVLDLDGHLGDIELDGHLALDDLARPEKPRLDVTLHGPDFAYLADILKLPSRPSGALRADVHLEPRDARMAFAVDVEVGNFRLNSAGSVDELAAPRVVDATIDATGRNAGAVAAVFGVADVPELPFAVTGRVTTTGDTVGFDTLRVKLGESELTASGQARPGPAPTAEARITARGANAANLAGIVGLAQLPAEPFTADGRLAWGDDTLRFDDLKVEIAANTVTANGKARLAGGLAAQATFEARGPNAAVPAAWFEAGPVPAEAYLAKGRVKWAGEQLGIDALDVRLGDNVLTAEGTVRPGAALSISAHVTLRGPDAAKLAAGFDVHDIPAAPYAADGRIAWRDGELRFDDLAATLGANKLEASGTARPGDAAQFDLRLAAGGPDAGRAAAAFGLDGAPAEAWTATGRIALGNKSVRFDDFEAHLGRHALEAHGSVQLTRPPVADANFSLKGPSVGELAQWFGMDDAPDTPYAVEGRVVNGKDDLRMEDFRLRVGDDELGGNVLFRPGERPYLDASLAAERLDLSAFVGPDPAATPEPPTKQPGERLIPDTPLPLDALALLDGRLHLEIGTVIADAKTLTGIGIDAHLADETLRVDRFDVTGENGGRFGLTLSVARSGKVALRLGGTGVQLGLPAETRAEQQALPHYDVDSVFVATGKTWHALAQSLSGYLVLDSGPGRLRTGRMAMFTNDFLAELLATINPFLKQDPYLEIECGVLYARADEGKVAVEPGLAVRSTRLNVMARARVDLATEALQADINTVPRKGLGISLSDLVNPYIQVAGTLAAPRLAIDKKSTLIEGGAAVATGGLSILAKGLFGRLTANQDVCQAAKEAAGPEYSKLKQQYGGDLSAG